MSRSLKGVLTIGLALGMASAALGQRQGGGMFGPGGLLMSPDVQKELKMSDDQVSKLKDAMTKVRDNHKGDFDNFRDKSPEEQRKVFQKLGDDTQKAIEGVLDEKQMKRFQQIQWQAAGPDALVDPKLQKELKLSDEQKKKLQDIMESAGKKMRALFQGGPGEGTMEKFQKIRKDAEDESNKVLTDEQKKKFKELKGDPFNFQRPGGRSR